MTKLIYSLTYEKLLDFLLEKGYKRYRADQVWEWLYVKKVSNFSEMSNLPKDLIKLLEDSFSFEKLELIMKNKSSDGTIKLLFGLSDKNLIECVLMNHHYGMSLCVTTQVGCNIGCSFCASGLLTKKRDLATGEIISQIIQTEKILNIKISSIVVMGIGEPFDNFNNIIDFLRIVNNQKGLNIGARRITVSTSGIVPKIYQFADLNLQVNLAISLHASFDEKRSKLMKINKIYSIDKVIEAIKYYQQKTNRRVTIEYILIDKINDNIEDAKELVRIFKDMNVYINLIPYNPVKEVEYKRAPLDRQIAFSNVLKKANIDCILRKEQGSDINAACGQLRSQVIKQNA